MAVIYNDDRQRLTAQIEEWNSNRLDLFALSQPNEVCRFIDCIHVCTVVPRQNIVLYVRELTSDSCSVSVGVGTALIARLGCP